MSVDARQCRPASLQRHQLRDGRSQHHQLLVPVEEEAEAGGVAVLLVRELLLGQIPGHDGLHLQTETERDGVG